MSIREVERFALGNPASNMEEGLAPGSSPNIPLREKCWPAFWRQAAHKKGNLSRRMTFEFISHDAEVFRGEVS